MRLFFVVLVLLVSGCAHNQFNNKETSQYISEYEEINILYNEFIVFKDEIKFIEHGFVEDSTYLDWMQKVQNLQRSPGYSPEGPRILTILAMAYRQEGKDSLLVQQMESKLKELLDRARITRDSTFCILYTGDTKGVLKPLAQGIGTTGGLARRGMVFYKIKEQENQVLALDAGDTFVPGDENKKINETLVQIMNQLEYSAMGLGLQDFKVGEEGLREIASQANFPMICSNLTFTSGARDWVKPYTVIQLGNFRVGILSLLPVDPEISMAGADFIPARDALDTYLPILKDASDCVVLLTQYTPAEIAEILKDEDFITVVFADPDGSSLDRPKYIFPTTGNSRGVGFFRLVRSTSGQLEPAAQISIPLSQSEMDVEIQKLVNEVY